MKVMSRAELKKIDRLVGHRLLCARILRGMSQGELADAIGLTFQQVQKYETGANRLSASRIYQIAKILRLKPAYFFEGLPEYGAEEIMDFTAEHIRLVRYYSGVPKEGQKVFMQLIKTASIGQEAAC
ncbi:MAG TPA: helix-turn-helix transcriptional regulator [Alphaproteobacteria bacterium]|nr:helix-turn-helix transcriptional regulator [Alphaproteobacteria bacterium]